MKTTNFSNIGSFCIILLSLILLFYGCENPSISDNDDLREFEIILADLIAEDGRGAIIKINPTTGAQTILSEKGRFQGGPQDIIIEEDGLIYTTVSYPPEIVSVDPDSGNQIIISSGGYLKTSIDGIAIENNRNLLVVKGKVQHDTTPRLLRIDKITGEQEVLSEGGLFWNIRDVLVHNNGEIYVSGQGIKTISGINYVVGALFRVNPISGEQTEVFKDENYTQLSQMDFDHNGSILVLAEDTATRLGTIISINISTGHHYVIVPVENEIYYRAITCADNGDIFVAMDRTFSGNSSICRVDISNGTLEPFSYDNYLDPGGMDIMYSK